MPFTGRAFVLSAAVLAASIGAGCNGAATATTIDNKVLTGAAEPVGGSTGSTDTGGGSGGGAGEPQTPGDVGDPMTPAMPDPAPPQNPGTPDAGPSPMMPGTGAGGGGGSTGLSGAVAVGSSLRTTIELNVRTGPGTSNGIRMVLPEGANLISVNTGSPENGWYNVSYNGVEGWCSGVYLAFVRGPVATPTQRDLALRRAQTGVGFSYWWGHGSWVPNGATSSSIGTCTGSCPDCTHAGSYGADCSGYLAKVWEVPVGNTDPKSDSHPYSTISFNGTNSRWVTVDRAEVRAGDALVYNANGAGHIFLYEAGDGWGSMWAFEARGCVYGIVHNLRTAGATFKAIERVGY